MTLLTPAELRTHVETDLPDAAIQRLLDSAEATIVDAAGAPGKRTEHFTAMGHPHGRDTILTLSLPVDSIDSVVERESPQNSTSVTLSANDYLVRGRRELIRLTDGDNPRRYWAPDVQVTYMRVADTDARVRAQIDLVKLAIQYAGVESERYGDVQIGHGSLTAGDERVRAALRPVLTTTSRPLPVT